MSSLRYLSMNQLSEITGKDRRTVKARLEGLKVHPGPGRGQYYDSREALSRIFTVSENKEKSVSQKLLEEQLRYEQVRSEKLALQVEQMQGSVVSIDDVARKWSEIGSRIKTKILGLASKMKQRHSELTLAQVATLEELSREALEEIANGEQQNTSV